MRRSITQLDERISELEGTPDQPRTDHHTRQLLSKLLVLDSDYKRIHLQIVDLIDESNTEALNAKQEHIDKLDDDVSGFAVRLESLSSPDAPHTPPLHLYLIVGL